MKVGCCFLTPVTCRSPSRASALGASAHSTMERNVPFNLLDFQHECRENDVEAISCLVGDVDPTNKIS